MKGIDKMSKQKVLIFLRKKIIDGAKFKKIIVHFLVEKAQFYKKMVLNKI
jgi:hypothetical protein